MTWPFVRFLRRGKTSNAFTNPPAFVQRWVANAQSRPGSILRNGVVYIGYVISLSVAFAAIISSWPLQRRSSLFSLAKPLSLRAGL